MKTPFLLTLVTILSLLLSACGAAAPSPTPLSTTNPTATQPQQEVISTAVAATVSALTTQVAELQQQKTPGATPTLASGTPAAATAGTPASAAAGAPPAIQSSGCEQAAFVADVTVPDGTNVPPGSTFTKTWSIRNTGSCAWTPEYRVVFAGGDLLGAPESAPLTDQNVAPGETVQVSVALTAPQTLQVHRSFWKFMSPSGSEFGVTDPQGNEQPVWAEIRVSNAYDFLANMCAASWRTGSGTTLTCPTDPNASEGGGVYRMNNSQWEGGVIEDEPVMVMVPPAGSDTTIVGQFPPVIVPEWSILTTRVGCLASQESTCNVSVKITYSVDGGAEQVLYQSGQSADGEIGQVDIRMIDYQLVGKSTSFIWYVTTNGAADGDKIFWFTPTLKP